MNRIHKVKKYKIEIKNSYNINCMKIYISFLLSLLLTLGITLGTCHFNNQKENNISNNNINNQEIETNKDQEKEEKDEYMGKNINLKINNTNVNVTWLDNESVNALKSLIKDNLSISMNRYGGFEQVGSINKTITSSDKRITTSPGDIVLYSSNKIVIFYGSNTWAYTKLGHINLTEKELTDLLSKEDVTIHLSLE